MKNRIDAVLANPTEPVKPIPTLPPARPQKQWICMLTNGQISSYFSAYADNLKEARVKTKQACQSKSDGIFCPDSALVCDSFESDQEVWSCEYQNHHSGKTYFGKGRSNIEAEFKTRTMCGDAGESFFCMSVISCEKN